MAIESYYTFILTCRVCRQQIEVGHAEKFVEKGTGEKTGYYHPVTGKIVGVSEGNGSTFECMPCHAVEWVKSQAEGEWIKEEKK